MSGAQQGIETLDVGGRIVEMTTLCDDRLIEQDPRQITEAEEALLWLRWLERDDARIVWLRAERTPWKPICWEMGISRATANRRWQYGIAVIVWRLNGKSVHEKLSRQHVISKA